METANQQWEYLTEVQMHQLHARLDALLMQTQQRVTEMEWRNEGMPVTPQERQEGFGDLRGDLHDDRSEAEEASEMAQLHERLEAMQQAREQEQQRGHDDGMGF
jgi:hypothetical protein